MSDTSDSPEAVVRKLDPEPLIKAVEKHPCLWNSSSPEYRSKTSKQDSWDEVASEVIAEWQDFTSAQKFTTVRYLIRRWNNIRDYFNKSLKSKYLARLHGKPEGSRGKRNYVFAKALEFLRPELEKNINVFVKEVEASEIIKLESEEREDMDGLEEEEEEEATNITFVDTLDHTFEESNQTSRKRRYSNINEDSLRREDDPDLMFLKSLLPDIKKLGDDEKFAFKYAIMEAYMGIINKRNNTK